MRTFTSLVAGLVATVAAIVSVPLFWVSTNVVDEDGYVAFSSSLATDRELQAAVAAYIADDYVQRGLLPASLQQTAASVLTSVAQGTVDQPGFVRAWEQTQRSLHTSAFGDGSGTLTVSLQPMMQFIAARVGSRLPISLDVTTDIQAPVGTSADRSRLRQVERSQTYALLGLMVVLASAALCLVSARRRTMAVAGLGLGALVTAGVLRVATEIVTPQLIDRAETLNPFARQVQKLLLDRASASLAAWLGWIALVGAVALLAGLLGRGAAALRSR
ncbi:hypothetical protein [Aeromicrobium endophyticum]|nr:hypothetical protein [Aeromicrobium endophyticum]